MHFISSIKKRTKPGCWLRVRGSTKNDKYSGNELVLNIRDINAIEVKQENSKPGDTVEFEVEVDPTSTKYAVIASDKLGNSVSYV